MEGDLRERMLREDRDDLMAVLSLRFGDVPQEVSRAISAIVAGERLERLILVAANCQSLREFQEEATEKEDAFRIPSGAFTPRRKEW